MRTFPCAILRECRILAALWRLQTAYHRTERFDDDAYARDTADLAAFDRRWKARPAYCPIPISECETCRPDPTDCSAEEFATFAEVNTVGWWLIEHLPEIWYREHPIRTRKMAAALVRLRDGVKAGRWKIETGATIS